MSHHTAKTLLAFVGGILAFTSYAFTTFETKENIKLNIIDRLDRIEMKLDRLIENQ